MQRYETYSFRVLVDTSNRECAMIVELGDWIQWERRRFRHEIAALDRGKGYVCGSVLVDLETGGITVVRLQCYGTTEAMFDAASAVKSALDYIELHRSSRKEEDHGEAESEI